MELTPETFEKAEFIERRRGGYDIDQVETFLEEAGTEFARMLVKFKQAESRVAEAEAKATAAESQVASLQSEISDLQRDLAASTKRAQGAESASRSAVAARPDSAPAPSGEEVSNVARALIMAQEAADKALAEAKNEAQSILDSARSRSERQMSDTNTKIDGLVREAKSRADREFASRREDALSEIAGLDERRSELGDLVSRMELRIAGYRDDLRRAAEELITIADDPALMGRHPSTIEARVVDGKADSAKTQAGDKGKAEALGDEISNRSEGELLDPTSRSEKSEAQDVDVVDVDVDDAGPDDADSADADVDDADVVDQSDVDSDDADVVDESAVDSADGDVADESDVDAAAPSDVDADDSADGDSGESTDKENALLDLRAKVSEAEAELEQADSKSDSKGGWEPGSWSRVLSDVDDGDGGDVVESPTGGASTGSTATATASRQAKTKVEPELSAARSEVPDDRSLVDQPTEAIDRVQLTRDRYLEELDQAVNTDLDSEDEALAAFLEGTSDSKSRRFGWRR